MRPAQAEGGEGAHSGGVAADSARGDAAFEEELMQLNDNCVAGACSIRPPAVNVLE
jgi:hypothetical protein